MRVRWSRHARNDRAEIFDYLAERDPAAAVAMDEAFSTAASRLECYPLSGHCGAVAGTRETKPHRKYRLIFEQVGDTIWILALIHVARQWPPPGE